MTITGVELTNFKCFRSLALPFRPLTVLTGYNAGGKSTVLQAILLLTQSLRHGGDGRLLTLNGDMARLGNPGDVLCRSVTDSRVIGFGIETDTARAEWEFEPTEQRGMLSLRGDERTTLNDGIAPGLIAALRDVTFLSTARAIAADVMPIPNENNRPRWDMGRDGSYAAYILDQQSINKVEPERRLVGNDTETVQGQVDGWLDLLFPGARVSASALEGVQLMKLEFRTGRAAGWVKPANIGFGLGYAFPLLVGLMTAPEGSVLIVDSPEAHLHPRAQSVLGRMLAQVAGAGVQIVIETHSDHLLNGIRLGVRDTLIAPDQVAIHFFAGDDDSRDIATLAMTAEGGVSEWPAGFFDQAINDLIELS